MDKKIITNKDGTIIKIKVVANASSNKIEEEEEYFKVRIKAPAVDNKANKELTKFLCEHFNVSKSNIEIIRGEKSTHKHILIKGIFL